MVAAVLHRTITQLAQHVDSPADDELLRRFVLRRDEAAFGELVQRHGAMVQGVARRALGDHHAAEDVLQATFLLLARKARHINWRRSVGPWLYAAAVRFARKAAHRRSRDPESIDPVPAVAADAPPDRPLLWQEVRSVLDEELARLPDALRAPLVLCYLQGLTRDEAAPLLGWTLATLKRRLEKGRERLRGRLARRGLGLAAMGALLAGDEAVSAAMIGAVVDAVCTGAGSAHAAVLLAAGRWRKLLAIALLVTATVGGVWFAKRSPAPAGQPADPPAAQNKPAPLKQPVFGDKVDALGDPLPVGAVARLGTVRLRPGKMIAGAAFSPDGKQLAIWCRNWGGGDPERLIFADPTTGREVRSIELPPNILLSMRWLADGRGLAVVKISAREYYLWQFSNEKTSLPRINAPVLNSIGQGDLQSVAIAPDGKWLATGRTSHDGSPQPIELWEVVANSPLSKLKKRELGKQAGHGQHVLFSGDGTRVFAVSRKQEPSRPGPAPGVPGVPIPVGAGKLADRAQVVVYETSGGHRLGALEVVPPSSHTDGSTPTVALSPDGKTLVIGDEKGVVHTYDWTTGKETHSFAAHSTADPMYFERAGVNALAFSPDGQTLYTASRSNVFAIRDAKTGEARATVRDAARGAGHYFALSPDGAQLAVADSGVTGRVRVFDTKTWKDPLALPGHTSRVTDLLILPDGTAVTAGSDNQLRWWDLETGRELKTRPTDVPMFIRKWSFLTADGKGLFEWRDRRLRHVDLATGKQTTVAENIATPWNTVHGVSGSTVFFTSADRKVRQWDADTGTVRQTYDPPPGHRDPPSGIAHAAMSQDERRFAMISTGVTQSGNMGFFNGSQISLYDAKTGGLRKRWQVPDAILECVEFSPDGRYFVVGGRPTSGTGRAAAADETMLPASATSALVLLDAETGEAIRGYEPAVKSPNNYYQVSTIAISPNSHVIAAVQHDNSIAVYELATGGVCRVYPGHRSEISRMAFTADGRRLVSVSADMTGLVWDTSYPSLAKPSAAGRDKLWADLAKPEWELAGSALAALASRPDEFLSQVRDRLPAATSPDFDPAALTKLIAQLSDQVFAARERASSTLARHGREVLPLLQAELPKTTSAEQRRRLQAAIDAVARSPVPSNHLRQVRVLALLEQQKSDASRAELKRLAAGHSAAALTRDAKATLER